MPVEFGCVQLGASTLGLEGGAYDYREHLSACPASCRPCSSCYRDVETVFSSVLGRRYEGCDCSDTDIGPDPCFARASCDCACSMFAFGTLEICGEGG